MARSTPGVTERGWNQGDIPKVVTTAASKAAAIEGAGPMLGGPGAGGAGTVRIGEQKPPGEEPITLELQRTSPGRLEERGSLTPEPGQVQIPEVFEAVAVYFMRKEWELVEDEDKVLYRDQMLKNYQDLVSLGKALVVASPWRYANSEVL
ncbi:hypothetical protein Y1Q_0010438 [Alligator mississippiensis]|uniref:KRAB domain-containing protein n=1 Tax=Alligator mississippiensis TaxID=8496 RepID=A0A151NVX7_ALLMI|nr:hypothetical protein Y1Q_0010438 [Alligator mississippiensis]